MTKGEYISIANALTKAARKAKNEDEANGLYIAREITYNLYKYGTNQPDKIKEVKAND